MSGVPAAAGGAAAAPGAAAAAGPVLETKKRSGILGLLRRGETKDLKRFVKETGDADYSGLLWKFKDKSSEWRQRHVEVRGCYLMWTSSKSKEAGSPKDYVDLQGCKLVDDASVLGVDASGKQRTKGSAVVYTVDHKGVKKQGQLRENALAVSRPFSFRLTGPGLGAPLVFAADGDHDKEEWWRHIQKGINLAAERAGEELGQTLEDLPLFASQDAKQMAISKRHVDFDFIHVVGRGAYGRVIKVREKATGNIYVCKVLEKQAIIKHRMLHEVKKESSLLQKVQHPNIVDLIHAFQTRDKLFLVMEFLAGGELFFHMMNEPTKRFTEDRANFYAGQLVLAVEYLHSLQIIHCDLKAENCVLTRTGYVKLTDFGFATAVHADEKVFKRNGTPVYMAPEMIQRRDGYSYPVDVWSLGVLLYAMLTGYFPFHGDTARQTLEFVCTRPLAYPPGVPVSQLAKQLLAKCLNRDPEQRITCTQMRADPFFARTNWQQLLAGKVEPPFVPDQRGTRYFPSTYEAEQNPGAAQALEAQVSMHAVGKDDKIFHGFAYVRSDSTRSQAIPRFMSAGSGELEDLQPDASVDDDCADSDFVQRLNDPDALGARKGTTQRREAADGHERGGAEVGQAKRKEVQQPEGREVSMVKDRGGYSGERPAARGRE
eukprot:TRINITY_DN11959_c0_g2_i1.p1 TRINITY_DN11959_c0_g2~~TRINITY_DN11959_c0_g2_i1.p1  ORF type:complete len:657 (+),score=152.66 TRINITY_DN11959_c0_g2_i1:260-2230(+)